MINPHKRDLLRVVFFSIATGRSEKEWLNKMKPEDFRGLTPLFYGHITPYGEFQLDMNKRINIEETI